MNWLISEDVTTQNFLRDFETQGFVTLKNNDHPFSAGDVVYIYREHPWMTIRFKCEVDEQLRLVLVDLIDNIDLSLVLLIEQGLKASPNVPQKLSGKLLEYIELNSKEADLSYLYPDSIRRELEIHEAIKRRTVIKQYELSPMARKKCIEHHGSSCVICSMNFEEKFGPYGKEMIQVHHTIPLYKVVDTYVIDYEKDLIPVCPNCHNMLHQEVDGVKMTADVLKSMVKSFS